MLRDVTAIRILVAEDSPTQAAQIEFVLEQRGFLVTVARNGREALELLKEQEPAPALVISDVVMPELDGYGLCRAIKSDPQWKDLPVILVTTLSDPVDVIRGLECGADNFIRKPYEESYLLSRIEYVLMNFAMRRNQRVQLGVEITLGGERHFINSERQQILDLLISTYEQAVQINHELQEREHEIAQANSSLSALYTIAEALNRISTEEDVTRTTVGWATTLPGVGGAWIAMREGAGELRVVAIEGVPEEFPQKVLAGELACKAQLTEGTMREPHWIDCGGVRHLAVPIRLDSRVLGLLFVLGPRQEDADSELLSIVSNAANQAAVAIDRARLYEHLEHLVRTRTAKLETEIAERIRIEQRLRRQAAGDAAVAELGRMAQSVSDPALLFEEACKLMVSALEADAAMIVEAQGAGKAVIRAAAGLDQARTTIHDDPLLNYLLHSDSQFLVSDVAEETRFEHSGLIRHAGFRTSISGVIAGPEAPFGAISVFRKAEGFLDGDLFVIRAIANTLASTLARIQSEASLRNRNALLQIAGRVGRLGAWKVRLPNMELTWSDEVRGIHEVSDVYQPSAEEAHNFYVPEYRAEFEQAFSDCVRLGTAFDREMQIITAKGNRKWIRVIGEADKGADGSVNRILGAIQDISESKAAAEETRQLAARLTETLDSITDAFVTVDREWRFTYVNRRAEAILQRSREELVGLNLWEALPDLADTTFGRAYRRSMEEGVPVSVEGYYAPLGIWLEARAFPSEQGITVYGRDVTEEHEASQRIAEQAALIDQAYDAIVVRDLEHHVMFWSRGAERVYGWSAAHAIGRGFEELLSIDSQQFAAAAALMLQHLSWNDELKVTTRDDRVITVDSRWMLLLDDYGHAKSILSFDTDITEKKKTETQLAESEARYRLVFERNPYPLWVYDLETLRFLAVNDAAVHNYGYSREEFLRMTLDDIRAPEHVDAFHRRIEQQPETEEIQCFGLFKHRTKDGRNMDVQITSSGVTFEGHAAGLVLAVDVTEQRELEQQFFRAQRMESIGTLASGVAHDLNNLLMPVMMGVSLLKRGEHDARALRALENIERSAKRGKDLVSQVLSFARGARGERTAVNAAEIVGEIKGIIDSTFPKTISLQVDIPSGLPAIEADPTQINQILLNLCVNARDAMPGGGRLTLAARHVNVDHHYARMHQGMAVGSYLVFEVSDEGGGIPREIRERIFDPFFTTKEVGKGTGLGLSTVSGIVKSHGGHVSVYSELGRGTTFRVYLPATGEQRSAVDYTHPGLEERPRGDLELILVIDDEQSILEITKQTLEAYNYRVQTAENGAEAVGMFALHKNEIAVVITDMMMPVMEGPSLIAALHRIEPSLAIIASSGIEDSAGRIRGYPGVTGFLRKPYSAGSLLRMLRQVIDRDPPDDERRPGSSLTSR